MGAAVHSIAVDLGASGGRVVAAAFDGRRAALRELRRFDNGPVRDGAALHWDVARLGDEIALGLRAAAGAGISPASVGVDTWGVDYGLLDASGGTLAPPRHYRDPRTHGMMERAFRAVPRDEIYARTGIQFLALNTLYQLLADAGDGARAGPLSAAHRLLFMPDLFHHWLGGEPVSERTIASTSQLLDAHTGTWAADLAARLGIPARILPPIVEPGTRVGSLAPALRERTGLGPIPVIAPACHDTASAVAAVPGGIEPGGAWAYISSGTWSLVGMERASPLCSRGALDAGFTNEAGVAGTVRFHRNVAGLWLLQECRRVWSEQGRAYSHEQIEALAAAEPARRSVIDPDDPRLGEFGDMPGLIRRLCAERGQPVPDSDAAVARCALDSLAAAYRRVIASLERVTGERIATIHVVGGGARNALLCQLTADATARPVIAGPEEATAMGNALIQAIALGTPGAGLPREALAEIRAVVARSVELRRYDPVDPRAWDDLPGGAGAA